ncbi:MULTISPECIES: phosphoenolpyruvate--protein phosphotransferase [Carboxydocella]|nr:MULTISPECIES: phosphoenolpyruvate--protein phosphotransferase [Carboxydocella]GAW27953.1 phosphoenolpyruvate--protein phosphotransferase [Carboxydocella sp. ULO1]GAW31559.1 phosphoenolpyruvate--protein phosphotransferase [Carboxydocella sp. JDF658]
MWKGIGASPGIAIGQVQWLIAWEVGVNKEKISSQQVNEHLERFEHALLQAESELNQLREKTARELGYQEARIFDAHLFLLKDPLLIDAIKENITVKLLPVSAAIIDAVEVFASFFATNPDPYLQERASDIRDVGKRLVRIVTGQPETRLELVEPKIVFAHDLTPSDTAQLNKANVLAFVTEVGGKTSHSAIMARALEIPAVVGVGNDLRKIANGTTVIVDGFKGLIICNPSARIQEYYKKRQRLYEQQLRELDRLRDLPAETLDGHAIHLVANIGTPRDTESAKRYGASGIGLFRTEFLYMDRDDMPGEEEQFRAYVEVVKAFNNQPVTIRTLDIGGDKYLPYLKLPAEANPFLGWRALRLCLDTPELFLPQLRAIWRASAFGKVRVMFPMVSSIDELRAAKQFLVQAREQTIAAGHPIGEIEVGIMVETPAAAILTDILAPEVDFFSIGTNDLTQYTIAVDRTNAQVSHLYESLNPAVLRLIKTVVDLAHHHHKWVAVCGELGGDLLAAPILLGLGVDELSMNPASLLKIKGLLRQLTFTHCQRLANKALACSTADEITNLAKKELRAIKTMFR